MSDESLFTSARRAVRFLNVDLEKGGGILTIQTEQALSILQQHVEGEDRRQRKLGAELKCPAIYCPQPYLCKFRSQCSADLLRLQVEQPKPKTETAARVLESDEAEKAGALSGQV